MFGRVAEPETLKDPVTITDVPPANKRLRLPFSPPSGDPLPTINADSIDDVALCMPTTV